MNYFAKNISYLRKRNNLKQTEIGSSVNITRATWSNYETGFTEPTLNKLIEIAKFFRISVDDLLLRDLVDDFPKTYIPAREKMTLEDNGNEDTTLWYLLKEMKAIRQELDNLKNK